MAITAFTSTAIIDATSIGKTVLTAASEGIAADAIGLGATDDVTFNSIDSIDGSFSGSLTSEVGGSIRHYSTGTEGDTDTSFVEIGDDGTRHTIYTSRTGAGTPRNLRVGNSAHYMEVLPAQTKMDWYISGTKRFSVSANSTEFFNNLLPITSGLTFGGSAQRWSNTYSVDGSFTGNLTSEVGGSYKLYNLGDESATDSEYLEIAASANVFSVNSTASGAGVGRTLQLGSGSTYMQMSYNGSFQMYRGGSKYMVFGSQNISVYKYMQPSSDLGVNFGSATRQWATGYFGSVVATGDVIMAANVDFTGLPTSDPAVAGRLYTTTGGTLKVSAG